MYKSVKKLNNYVAYKKKIFFQRKIQKRVIKTYKTIIILNRGESYFLTLCKHKLINVF